MSRTAESLQYHSHIAVPSNREGRRQAEQADSKIKAWPKPKQPGDTLHVESEILEITPSRSKPNQAIGKIRSITLNQHGEPVHSFTSKCLVFKRPQLTT